MNQKKLLYFDVIRLRVGITGGKPHLLSVAIRERAFFRREQSLLILLE